MIDNFLYIGLPYMAILSFILGSFIRFRYYGYSVTSHSSQFLESKRLFWGSRFFHFGIVLTIAGHIVGFIFPQLLVAITTNPLRLEITESIAATIGFLALLGITILIIRRVDIRQLRKVTSTMDVVVYIVLFNQIVLGLLIAYYNRWGISWYSSSVVPYLRSICYFAPDVKVITSMPILIRMHAVNAFLIILLIPFTRLVHFLAYPFQYFFRNYILVIWNRDMKAMRSSTRTREGKEPENN